MLQQASYLAARGGFYFKPQQQAEINKFDQIKIQSEKEQEQLSKCLVM